MPTYARALFWPVAIAVMAAVLYDVRIHRSMVDFGVYHVAAGRALAAEPLYREDDGHYKFKYMPAFAIVMAPFAGLELRTAKAVWFALSVGLLAAFVRWSVYALPGRRRSERVLMIVAVVLMARFYGHELTLGQSNILLGTVLVTALLAAEAGRPLLAGALFGLAVFVKPLCRHSAAVGRVLLRPWRRDRGRRRRAGRSPAPGRHLWLEGQSRSPVAWYRTVTASTASTLVGADNISLAGMWGKWLGAGPAASVLATVSCIAMLVLVAATWLRRRTVAAPEDPEVSLLMLLIPPSRPRAGLDALLLATPAVIASSIGGPIDAAWRALVATSLVVMGVTLTTRWAARSMPDSWRCPS